VRTVSGVDEMQKCKIGVRGVSVAVAGKNLMDPIFIPWVKDEHMRSNGRMIVDRGMAK
jgi:hypothetical protein